MHFRRKYYMWWSWIYVLVIKEQWNLIYIKCIKKLLVISILYALLSQFLNINFWYISIDYVTRHHLPSQGCFRNSALAYNYLGESVLGQCGLKSSNLCVNIYLWALHGLKYLISSYLLNIDNPNQLWNSQITKIVQQQ